MNSEQWKDLLARLDSLGDKIGETGSAIFQMAVRQAKIEGFENILLAASCLIIIFVAYRIGNKAYSSVEKERAAENRSYRCWGTAETSWLVCSICAGSIALISFPIFLIAAFDCLLNPQYQAFQRLISMAAGK